MIRTTKTPRQTPQCCGTTCNRIYTKSCGTIPTVTQQYVPENGSAHCIHHESAGGRLGGGGEETKKTAAGGATIRMNKPYPTQRGRVKHPHHEKAGMVEREGRGEK